MNSVTASFSTLLWYKWPQFLSDQNVSWKKKRAEG